MNYLSMASVALWFSLSANALAQVGNQTQMSDPKCRATTDQHTSQDGTSDKSADLLTGKLSECEGVLKPPPTGDTEFAEPPPEEGNTPVIKPKDLPKQNK